MLTNSQIAKIFYEISEYLEMEDEPFRPRAYQRAARIIEAKDRPLKNIYNKGGIKALKEMSGIGEGIATKIEELLKTGELEYFKKLKKKAPVDVSTLTSIEGLGPKKIKALYKNLNVRNLKDLEAAAKAKKIRDLEGFGEKTEENILKGIEFVKKGQGRILLGKVLPLVDQLKEGFKNLPSVTKVEVAGSVRRKKETVGDIDMLVVANDSKEAMEYFENLPELEDLYGKGKTKSSGRLSIGIDMDVRVVPEKSFGAALQYFTGSKDHNVALRKIAKSKGLKLSEYGLFRGKKQIEGRQEEKIYAALGLDFVPPELRENIGEVKAAQEKRLPNLIPYNSLKGDLQIQTNWSDGAVSIEQMAHEAMKVGLEYILITDHTQSLSVANGLNEKRLLEQMKAIDKINTKFEKQKINFRILKGSEVDILKDGRPDIKNEVLSKLDIALGAIHSNFNLSRQQQTNRLVKAMKNPFIDIIAHPTGRVIKRREPYDLDMQQIFKSAERTNTILEIDAYYDRLDIKDIYIKEALSHNIKLVINSDAHHPSHLSYLNLGIATARRGWAEKKDILNTLSVNQLLKKLPKRNG